jgi:hypothetical protein
MPAADGYLVAFGCHGSEREPESLCCTIHTHPCICLARISRRSHGKCVVTSRSYPRISSYPIPAVRNMIEQHSGSRARWRLMKLDGRISLNSIPSRNITLLAFRDTEKYNFLTRQVFFQVGCCNPRSPRAGAWVLHGTRFFRAMIPMLPTWVE